jgi:MFS family permease
VSSNIPPLKNKGILNALVIVAALGYFVDVYDLVLFGIVRKASLIDIGITDEHLLISVGAKLLNWQMGGMLIGGIIWGIIGDKIGRISVLFGSILIYSIANIANGFVAELQFMDSVQLYALLRFFAGVGLAGELGAGITLVSETLKAEQRGYGTMLVATIGISGAVVANLVAGLFDWKISYFVGGGMGLALLILRFGVYESGMFRNIKSTSAERGNFFSLFSSWKKTKKYLSIILIAVPVWYVVGILMFFSPELGQVMGLKNISAGDAIMYSYIGITVGDLASGVLSQIIKSRIKALRIFMLMTLFFTVCYFVFSFQSLFLFYSIAGLVGFATGYWAVFITTAAEQFGTNIRSTVTTTAPNFVRGSVILLTSGFQFFHYLTGNMIYSAIIVGVVTFSLSFIALANLDETFGKDLDYVEE